MLILNVSTSFYYNFVGNFVGLFHKKAGNNFFHCWTHNQGSVNESSQSYGLLFYVV